MPKARVVGEKTGKQIDQEMMLRLDLRPMVTSCALCGWSFTGTVDEGRSAAKAHRVAEHPDRPVTPRQPRKGRMSLEGNAGEGVKHVLESDPEARAVAERFASQRREIFGA